MPSLPARTTTTVSITLELEGDLTEDELFPDGRPETLPPGPLSARDLLDYLRNELRGTGDLADWGFACLPFIWVRTPEGDRATGTLAVMP